MSNSDNELACLLSNFTERSFTFEDVECKSIEGVLQALKCSSQDEQAKLCRLNSKHVQKLGQKYNNWKETQILFWRGIEYERSSRRYFSLITRLYDIVYQENEDFRNTLRKLENQTLCHSIGKTDMRDTVLTEVEMIYQLNRLRICLSGRDALLAAGL